MTGVVVGLAGLIALGWKLVDFLRLLTNAKGQRSAIVTQLVAWLVFIALLFLYGASQLGDFTLPGTTLSLLHLSAATKVIVGLMLGSTASVGVDVKQALDNQDSAAKPPLLVPQVSFGPAARLVVPATPLIGGASSAGVPVGRAAKIEPL